MKVLPFSLKYNKVEQNLFYLLNIALLIFGTSFSKFNVIGPLYFHDFLLGVLTLLAFRKIPGKVQNYNIVLIFILAVAYLSYSILYYDLSAELQVLAIRQFAPFLYLFCCYIIVIYRTNNSDNVSFIIRLSILSFTIQIFYYVYGLAFIPSFSLFDGYPYFTPLTIMGIITFSSYILLFSKRYNLLKYSIVLIVSTMLGHSSAFLAVFMVGGFYGLLKLKTYQRLLAVSGVFITIFFLSYFPQFNDNNASWRILYWQHILNQTANLEKLGFLGNGFGKPYMTYEYAKHLESILGPTDLAKDSKPLLRWLTPPHNSLLTLAFHVGILPVVMFICAPLQKPIKALFTLSVTHDNKDYLFTLLALVGLLVWISFNVILELPHSAIYFWLVFFTLIKFHHNKLHATEQ